jgi:hypothetical protein
MPSAQVVIRQPQKNFLFQMAAKEAGFQVVQAPDRKTLTIIHADTYTLMTYLNQYSSQEWLTTSIINPMTTKLLFKPSFDPNVTDPTLPQSLRSWFKPTEYASIYKFPQPSSTPIVVGVISFGGGLIGQLLSGILTKGDVQAYWTSLGILAENQPTVAMVFIDGATNDINPITAATQENTLDVEMIGACCPTSNLTIILYIAPNSINSFQNVFNYAITTPVQVNGISMVPSILTCSWGAPEIYFNSISSIDTVFAQAASAGINIFVATGDSGSSGGLNGLNCDYPSSSPNVIACGGTSLTCPDYIYNSNTIEVAWKDGGGGISRYFSKPSYQSVINSALRNTPDLALNADPNTGVLFFVGGQYTVFGGTSIVAPAMAAYMAALGSPAGFINLKIYLATNCFNDILIGSNGEYFARSGYDNVSGLGSIDGNTLRLMLTDAAPITDISVSPTSVTFTVNQTRQITGTVQPIGVNNKQIEWSSLNTQVATVSSTGLVTAVAEGSTYIIAIAAGNSTKRTSVLVNVTSPIKQILLNKTSLNLVVNQVSYLTFTLTPTTVVNKTVTWASSDSSIATVDQIGKVTAVSNGKAIITVTTADLTLSASCSVSAITPVSSLTISKDKLLLEVGRRFQLFYTFLPEQATNQYVIWRCSDSSIIRLSNSGHISALAVGTATVTAISVENRSLQSSCEITVIAHKI